MYKLRNLPCNITTEDKLWCISGVRDLEGDLYGGVLEWCYDEQDVKNLLVEMEKDSSFKVLQAHPFLQSYDASCSYQKDPQ